MRWIEPRRGHARLRLVQRVSAIRHEIGKPDTRQLWGGEYRPGTLVRHPEWGLGVVQKQEGEGDSLKLTIIFRNMGRKVVAAKYAKLEKVSS